MFDDDDDDIKIPDPPATRGRTPTEYDELVEAGEFKTETHSLDLTDYDAAVADLNAFEKKLVTAELKDCDLYLYNLHTQFKYTTSVNSVIKNVFACLTVHKHRRFLLKEMSDKKSPKSGFDLDVLGNPIRKG